MRCSTVARRAVRWARFIVSPTGADSVRPPQVIAYSVCPPQVRLQCVHHRCAFSVSTTGASTPRIAMSYRNHDISLAARLRNIS